MKMFQISLPLTIEFTSSSGSNSLQSRASIKSNYLAMAKQDVFINELQMSCNLLGENTFTHSALGKVAIEFFD
jgi:hypothetical protein